MLPTDAESSHESVPAKPVGFLDRCKGGSGVAWAFSKKWFHEANIVARLRKTSSWLFYGVFVGSLPIAFIYIRKARLHDGNLGQITLDEMFGEGDLFLLATAIAGGAVGELVGASKKWLTTKRLAQAGCIIFVACSSLWFDSMQDHDPKVKHFDAIGSVFMFVGSTIELSRSN